MKKLISLFTFCLIFISVNAQKNMQDVVYLKSGTVIRGTIIEQIPDKTIKIQSYDNNIYVFDFNEIEKITREEATVKYERIESNEPNEKFFSNKKDKYYSLAAGFGQSYGGLGVRFQGRYGRKLGIGYHGGMGVNPVGPSLFFSVGVKFFWYKAWYLDFQFGPHTFTRTIYYFDNNYNFYQKDEDKVLFGPSFLIGGDWFFNKSIGVNAAFGLAKNFSNNEYNSVNPAMDLGIIFKF